MADARQLKFPIEVRIADLRGDAFGVAYACAIWPPEAGPFLRRGGAGKN